MTAFNSSLTTRPWLATCLLLGAALLGCQRGPVEWDEARATQLAPPTQASLTLDARGEPRFVELPSPAPPRVTASCTRAVLARMTGREWYAAWWRPRPDSSVALVVTRTADAGSSWAPPVVADARDASRAGCQRLPPAIAADSSSGYVHLVYSLAPPAGAGVWFTHSMERGALWHEPVAIVFGERAARADVAAAGDTVLVAFEHPGPKASRVGLAISRTAGHSFSHRMQVSGQSSSAVDPRVALRGREVAVAWRASDTTAPFIIRTGTLIPP